MFRPLSILLIFFGISGSTTAQEQFIRTYGSTGYDVGRTVLQTEDGGYLLLTNTSSFGLNNTQIMLVRVNDRGDHLWNKFYGGELADVGGSIVRTGDGGLVITGYTQTADSTYNLSVFRTDAEGELMWTKRYGGTAWDFGKKVVAMSDGGFVIVGQTHSRGEGQGDAILMRFNTDGDTLWTRTYGGPMPDGAESVALSADGGFVIAGFTESFGNGMKDAWMLRVDVDGNEVWAKSFGGEEDDFAYGVIATSDGGFALCGSTAQGEYGGQNFYVVKVRADGELDWDPEISTSSGPNDDVWTDIIYNESTGELTTCGYSANPLISGADENMYISRRYSSGGWWAFLTRVYGGAGNDRAYGLIQTTDGGYALVGETDGFLDRFQDIMLVKVSNNGDGVPFTVDVQEVVVEGDNYDIVLYPNPTHGQSTLHLEGFDIWASRLGGSVTLQIYDVAGRMIHQQLISKQDTQLSLKNAAPGIYTYRVMAGQHQVVAGRLVRD
ncbi:MAG: T9SS type A sorting domain-containing protein [Flavobacteriales bacterium]|nr:T9SS type A sorting domain-containing protein [Flavobacteriales bacterium]